MTTTELLSAGTGTDFNWRTINAIRFLSVDAVQAAKSGHPGAPLGAAPMAWTLWDRFLKHNPQNPSWPDRDRFVLSNGHASMLLYSLLHLTGYDLPIEEIRNFRQLGSKTPGHPERGQTPGVEVTTGPLGQGFANGVGMALAEKILSNEFNRPGHNIIDHRTFAIVSDGDLEEGVASEAASLAGMLGLGKIVYLYDDNQISIEGDTDLAFREDVAARFRAYGWHVSGPVDGNDLDGIAAAIQSGVDEASRPSLVIVTTTIGYGSPNKAGKASSHGEALGDEEIALTRAALGWDSGPFEVPSDVRENAGAAVVRGAERDAEWHSRFDVYAAAHPELAARLRQDMVAELPEGWDAGLTALAGSFTDPVATRAVSGKALHAIAANLPRLIGGSADLAGSNNTMISGRGSFQPESPDGRNLHFGVREHAMGAVINGISAHGGLLPYGGTFLIFSDYMRGAVRVGALSELPAVWIWTHDSIGLGEDGPTHQPIDQLMSLRMLPGLTLIRPADADETLAAWKVAVENRHGPTALALTRQALPSLESLGATVRAAGNLERGAYVALDCDGKPDLILIGTGSEVQLAIGAASLLSQDNVKARVVSMPSWVLFDAQSKEYRESVMPRSVRARVAVEAGIGTGWEHYVGLDGAVVGMEGFGASGPGGAVMKHFGFTVENLVAKAKDVLRRLPR
jgi:transketolase